jgi:NAD+ kinase
VVVVAKVSTPEGRRAATELGTWLEERGVEVLYDVQTARAIERAGSVSRETLPSDVDLVVVAGGDGTLLSVARSAAPQKIPILGINLGGLGFLTELHPSEQFSGLEAVLAGHYEIEERQTLRVRMERPGEATRRFTLLNDAVVSKSALARMLSIGVRIDGQDVATYTSDGLIVATPTGSTAYNLAAGGPILDPRMGAFVLAPICPHTMTHRPLVVPGSVVIEVFLHNAGEEVYLTLDGQIGFPFHATDRISIDREAEPARLVRVTRRSFFEVLRKKLRWGER